MMPCAVHLCATYGKPRGNMGLVWIQHIAFFKMIFIQMCSVAVVRHTDIQLFTLSNLFVSFMLLNKIFIFI